jgi:hypothetical protein
MSEHGLAKLTMSVLVAGFVMCALAQADVEMLWTYDYNTSVRGELSLPMEADGVPQQESCRPSPDDCPGGPSGTERSMRREMAPLPHSV